MTATDPGARLVVWFSPTVRVHADPDGSNPRIDDVDWGDSLDEGSVLRSGRQDVELTKDDDEVIAVSDWMDQRTGAITVAMKEPDLWGRFAKRCAELGGEPVELIGVTVKAGGGHGIGVWHRTTDDSYVTHDVSWNLTSLVFDWGHYDLSEDEAKLDAKIRAGLVS